jgi:hypothetical protein
MGYLAMKGLVTASDLYAPVRATYRDGRYPNATWAGLLSDVGDRRKRLRFLGDRLLDRLEARMLRDQIELPPGLSRLVDEYRSLFRLQPKQFRFVFQAHENVLDVQARLTVRLKDMVE